jgi:dolichol-phosphate mannosyltransferase
MSKALVAYNAGHRVNLNDDFKVDSSHFAMEQTVRDTLIFVPTYNEAGNIGELLRLILKLELSADVLVIDDNSTDGTADVVRRVATTAPCVELQSRPGKLGIGSAHLQAIRHAKERGYRVLITMDADFSHQPSDIPRFLQKQEEWDVVVGSRFEAARSLREWSAFRKAVTHLGHFLTKALLDLPYDATGAFRLYRLDRIPDHLIGMITAQHYEFFFESLAIFHQAGLQIDEVPVVLPRRTYGHSKMQFAHMIRGVCRLLQLSFNLMTLRRQFRELQPAYYHPEKTAEEWNEYWGQREPRPEYKFYEVVASFYRKYLIKRTLNHFIQKTFKPGERLLHAGCGSGEVDEDVVKFANVTALDISPAAIGRYKSRFNIPAMVGDVFRLPDAPRYDGVYNLGVMEHFSPDEIRTILTEFNRTLSANGRLLLFWPPVFGLSVFALKILRWTFKRILRREIVFHPAEPSLVRSRQQVSNFLDQTGFQLREYYFGIRDAFTYVVVVADKKREV